VVPHEYPDTSGTGIPDIVQRALGGDPTDPTQAVFPGDGDARIELHAADGQLHDVRPVTPPAGAGGLAFPAGFYSFSVTGLAPGAPTIVSVGLSKGAAQYWRYGPKPGGIGVGWYQWTYDAAALLGPSAVHTDDAGAVTQWNLFFRDGQPGDDDGVANGTIVDPGGAANGVGPSTDSVVSTVPAPLVVQPAFTG
jgi:hypothetical protein